jgi:hypothetical protein
MRFFLSFALMSTAATPKASAAMIGIDDMFIERELAVHFGQCLFAAQGAPAAVEAVEEARHAYQEHMARYGVLARLGGNTPSKHAEYLRRLIRTREGALHMLRITAEDAAVWLGHEFARRSPQRRRYERLAWTERGSLAPWYLDCIRGKLSFED